MSRMSNSEYNEAKRVIQDTWHYGSGSKESYIQYIRGIIASYDDGAECAKQLDHYQTRYNINDYVNW